MQKEKNKAGRKTLCTVTNEFLGMNELERITQIHNYPVKFSEIIDSYEELMAGNDGYQKGSAGREGGSSGRSDVTANSALNIDELFGDQLLGYYESVKVAYVKYEKIIKVVPDKRNREILERRLNGEKYYVIGKEFGLHEQRVAQIAGDFRKNLGSYYQMMLEVEGIKKKPATGGIPEKYVPLGR